MILADISVWIDHLRGDDPGLSAWLEQGLVCMHPFIIGELACGRLRQRAKILSLLQALPRATEASHAEVLHFIDRHALAGRGIGLIDAHLLAAAALGTATRLWTRDRALGAIAGELGLALA